MKPDTPGVTATAIRLGSFMPLTGPMAPRGLLALAGLKAALKRFNDRDGGVYGRRLELVALDDEFNPDRTRALARRLVEEDEVFALVGPVGTPTNTAVIDYLEAHAVPVVAPLSGSSLLSMPPKRNCFTLQVNYVVEGMLLARYAVETLGSRRIAVYYSDDDFGQEGARAFMAELDQHGLQPVHIERGWRGAMASGVIVERLRAAEPDTVLMYIYIDQAAELLREAHQRHFQPRWIGSYVLWDPVLFDLAGVAAAEGLTVGQPYLDPLGFDPQAEAYRLDLAVAAHGARPGGYSASGYTAGHLAVEGLRRAGPELTREAFVAALEGLSNWSGGLITGLSYSPYDRRGVRRLSLSRASHGRWVLEKTTVALRDQLLTLTSPLALQVSILSRQVMEQLGKERIRQKAIDVAQQCAIFIRQHPDWTTAELQANPEFQRIAVQSIGATGYTAVYGPAPTPMMLLHPNPELINVDLRTTDRPQRFPDWWRLYQYSLDQGGQAGGGFYNWADADGVVRQKYQYFLPIEGTPYIVGATTYLQEFFQPFEDAERAIRRTVHHLTAEIARQILDPIQDVLEGVERVSQGDLTVEIKPRPAEEAQWLSTSFNQMTRNLRALSERWAELNRELEARVADRTRELETANLQLQISNRSLQEINRQLSEAKTAAERAQLEAEEANRLKSRFLSNISHELRIPLNAILNFSKLLLVGSEGALTDGQADFLARIRDAGEHQLGLLNDMLDLARIEAGVFELYREVADIGDIIRGVMSTAVGLTRDKPIQLHQELADDLPPAWVDRSRVRQVLLNLLSNAAKFTERGSITVRAERAGEHLQVSVADTGMGIAPPDRARIFESYVKGRDDGLPGEAQAAGLGAGLGLTISRQLVELHGGSIWVESQVGRGSTFTFTLPVARHGEPGVLSAEPPGLAAPAGGGAAAPLVLVVDSDRLAYRGLAQPLMERGCRVAGLSDPTLLPAKLGALQPSAVVMDAWQLMGAEQLAHSVQANWPGLPLLVTGAAPAGGEPPLPPGAPEDRWKQASAVRQVLAWVEAIVG